MPTRSATPKRDWKNLLIEAVATPFPALLITSMVVWTLSDGRDLSGTVLEPVYHWLEAAAPALRIVLPSLLILCATWAALFLVKHWRLFTFGIIHEIRVENVPMWTHRSQAFWLAFGPMSVIMMCFGSAMILYAEVLWLYDSCIPFDTVQGIREGFQCHLSPSLAPYLYISGDQFARGALGPFTELFFPGDSPRLNPGDDFLLLTTILYRAMVIPLLLALPLCLVGCVKRYIELRRWAHSAKLYGFRG